MLVLFSSIKPKELPHILPTTSLFIPRLYHVGIIDRSLVHFPGSSGVTLRAPYSYSDGRFMNYEPYNMLDYNISVFLYHHVYLAPPHGSHAILGSVGFMIYIFVSHYGSFILIFLYVYVFGDLFTIYIFI